MSTPSEQPHRPAATCLSLERIEVAIEARSLARDLSFEVRRGEFLAITGPSGSGKTLLLRTIAGLIDAAGGEIRLDGRSGAEIGWPSYRRRVLYVSQRPALLETTVEENLRRPFRWGPMSEAFRLDEARALLGRLSLGEDILAREARSLSEGEQQRICLVRALLIEPAFLLLDEPTSALDPAAKSEVESLLLDMRTAGLGALIVTHDLEQANRLGTRRMALGEGRAA